MILQDLIESLILHEGWKTTVYTCTAGKPTVGVGHNLERPLSDAAIMQILRDDIDTCAAELDRARPNWRQHDEIRQNVLVEMCFNLGMPRLHKFSKMWAALDEHSYPEAAKQMLHSNWAVQVGTRAQTLANRMRSGT
jgi:lysozyme